jgi:hypothetical protein
MSLDCPKRILLVLLAVPPEHKLSEFLSAAQTLSPDFVGNVLLEILCDSENWPAWQSRVKALIVIGSLGLNRDCVSHADWWRQQDHLDAVRGLLNDNKPTVRNQASKTSKILLGQSRDMGDLSAPPSTSNSPKPVLSSDNYNTSGGPGLTPQIVPVRQESLLDLLDDSSSSSVPVAQSSSPLPSTTSASGGGGMDLFSGMSVGGGGGRAGAPVVPSHQPQPQQGSSVLSNPSTPIATTNTASLPPLPPASSQPPVPAAPPSQLISNSFDFLSDDLPAALPPTNNNYINNNNNNNSSGVAPGQGQGGLFDNMNMNMNMTSDGNNSASLSMKTTAGSYQDDLASLSSSSSFSFMGGAGGGQVGGMGIGTMGSMGGGGSTGMRVPVSSSAISTAFTQNTPQAEKNKNDQAFSQVTNNQKDLFYSLSSCC